MIWKTCRLRVASRPATAITTMAVSQPDIQAAAFLGECSKDMTGPGDSRPAREVDRRGGATSARPWRRAVRRLSDWRRSPGAAALAAGDGATGTAAGELIEACRS